MSLVPKTFIAVSMHNKKHYQTPAATAAHPWRTFSALSTVSETLGGIWISSALHLKYCRIQGKIVMVYSFLSLQSRTER